MIRLVSWNLGGLVWNQAEELLSELHDLDADVALVQEARLSTVKSALQVIPAEPTPWRTAGVKVDGETAFTAVSVYAPWEGTRPGWIWADGSAHRILSDLSALIRSHDHRLVASGDWNILRGYGEDGDRYWKARYQTVFDRADTLGLKFVGPQHPDGGRQADPWPDELPDHSRCVPTFHSRQQTPTTATRQLDFVFASDSLADAVSVRALNTPEQWGGSDHCRVLIEVDA